MAYSSLRFSMAGKKQVDKVTKGLNALVDEFTSAVKEMVNAGEETVVHLAVGSGRVIKAVVNATGEVTKVAVETGGGIASSIGGGVTRVVKGDHGGQSDQSRPKQLPAEEEEE